MTYEEAIAYLESLTSFGIRPGLERMRALSEKLGRPETAYRVIHVTGTNGKGSVTAYMSSALVHSGCRTGRFTSPHLFSYTERMNIDGRDISETDFAAVIEEVRGAAEACIAEGGESPTQFEVLTAAAFLYFAREKVDYAVVEVGLGGTLDSTNIVTPIVSIITNVSIDHQAFCGETVEDIAAHKAGIIKCGVPVVTAAQEPALSVIKKKAKELKAPLYVFDKDFSVISRSASARGQMITLKDAKSGDAMLFTGLAGVHQTVNLACAVKAIRLVALRDERISEETMREGLARAEWPGRFEVFVVDGRTVIFDGAHNASGAEAFSRTYEELFAGKTKTVVTAMLEDKDVSALIGGLVHPGDRVFTVPAPTPRTRAPEALAKLMPTDAMPTDSVEAGMRAAFDVTPEGGIIVVAGSLYILGEARAFTARKAN